MTVKCGEHQKTGEEIIVEDIGKRNGIRHLFWGAKIINGNVVGNNIVGKIWMELRKEL